MVTNMAYCYILRSIKDYNLYVGSTTLDPTARLAIHNAGKVRSTKTRRPFILVYSQAFNTFSDARKFEWQLKYTPWGGKLKKQLVSPSAGSSNGPPEADK